MDNRNHKCVCYEATYPVLCDCGCHKVKLAKVGLIALIDEATGYQDVRDNRALQDIYEDG